MELVLSYGFRLTDFLSVSGDSVKRIEFPVTGMDFMTLLVTHIGKLVVVVFFLPLLMKSESCIQLH